MKKLSQLLFLATLLFTAVSCSKDDDEVVIPVNQEIVTSDTTLVTGKLTVVVKYLNGVNLRDAPVGTRVRLFGTYEDMQNGLDIYDLETGSQPSVFFGFINYGTYYVRANITLNGTSYTSENAVQVRPNRSETLTVTMFP